MKFFDNFLVGKNRQILINVIQIIIHINVLKNKLNVIKNNI